MDIKSLAASVKSQLRSGFKISSFKQCVVELVLNSIDAKSTAIAIRINLASFRIQVVDNGCGISQANMNLISTRYATSKCRSLGELEKRPKSYGFRGEALASIVSCSKKIVIISRVNDDNNTYSRTFENGKWGPVEVVHFRPSKGTTITIENFLYNMPVRKEQIKPNLDMEEIRLTIESLSFVHPSISFSIRDNINNKIIFQSQKVDTVAAALINAYPDIKIENFEQLQVTKDKINVTGLIYKYPYSINKLQLIYVNKRPVECQSIQKSIKKLFSKSLFHQRCIQVLDDDANYPIYLLNISCPTSMADISLEHTKTLVEFKRWDIVLKCIEKLITKFLEEEELLPKSKTNKSNNEIHNEYPGKVSSGVNLSNINGVFRSVPAKRKKDNIDGNKKEIVVKKLKSCHKLETVQQESNKINNEIELPNNNSHSYEQKNALATKKNMKSIFDRHNNTQSLVLNSETEHEPKIEFVDTKVALNETQAKGKSIILDMFLKSAIIYKSDSPKSIFNCIPLENFRKPLQPSEKDNRNEDKTNMTVSIKANTHRTVVKSSIYTITRANSDSGSGRNQTKCREVAVQTSVRNYDDENYSKTKSTKCIQTTLQHHEKITMDEQRELQMHFNFDNNNENVGNSVSEITLYNILNAKFEKSLTNDAPYTFNSNTLFETNISPFDLKKPYTEIKNNFLNLKNPQNFYTSVDSFNKYNSCCKSKINLYDMKFNKNKKCYQPYYSNETSLSNTKYIEETYNMKNVDNILKNRHNYFQCAACRNLTTTNYTNWNRCSKLEDSYQMQSYEFIPKLQRNIKSSMCKKMLPVMEETNRRSCCYEMNNILSKQKHQNLYDKISNQNYRTQNILFVPRSFDKQCNSKCSFDSHENYLKKSSSFPTCQKYCTNHNKPMEIMYNIANRNQKNLNNFGQNPTVQQEKFLRRKNMNLNKKQLNKCKSKKCLKHFIPQKQQENVSHPLKFLDTWTMGKCPLGYKNDKEKYGHDLKKDSKSTFKKPLDIQYKSRNEKDSLNKLSFQPTKNFKFDFGKSQQQEKLFYDKETVRKSNNVTEFTVPYSATGNHDDLLFEKTLDETDLNNLETEKSAIRNKYNIKYDSLLSEIGNPLCMSTPNDFYQNENQQQKFQFQTEQNDKETHCEHKPFTLSVQKTHSYPETCTSPIFSDSHINKLNEHNLTNDKLFCNEKNTFHININDEEHRKGDRSPNYCSTDPQNWLSKLNVENNAEFETNNNYDEEQVHNINSKQNDLVDKEFIADEGFLLDNKKCLECNHNSSKSPELVCDGKELYFKSEDKLVISFSETEMNLLIKKDLLEEADNYNNCGQSDSCLAEENNKGIDNRKMFDLKTGMTLCPTLQNSDVFNFTKRIPCIPKGLSPILIFNTNVDTELSQNSKDNLLMKIMESYEDELKDIKWEKIKTETDVNGVLDELYTAKCKNYEIICPILLPLSVNQALAIKFSKEIFNEINVIGSMDKKFIVVYAQLQKLLIIIDQHAAHERVRLEILINEYIHQEIKEVTFKQSKLKEIIPLKLSSDEVQCLSSHDVNNHFKKLGVSYNIQGNCMDVVAVPTCLFNKVFGNVETEKVKLLKLFVSSFIKEELDFLKDSRCFSKTIPNFLNKIINLEACRGAIKFGDLLTIEECQKLIQSLSLCKLPFQCAHGRPTMMPLGNMWKMPPKIKRDRVNLKKLKVH